MRNRQAGYSVRRQASDPSDWCRLDSKLGTVLVSVKYLWMLIRKELTVWRRRHSSTKSNELSTIGLCIIKQNAKRPIRHEINTLHYSNSPRFRLSLIAHRISLIA